MPSPRTSSSATRWSRPVISPRPAPSPPVAPSSRTEERWRSGRSGRCDVTAALPDDRFFRRESSRLVATLTRVLGVHHLALAEDAVQETLAAAVQVWAFRGLPGNPSAWLMTAARNRAISMLRRERTSRRFAPEIGRLAEAESIPTPDSPGAHLPDPLRDDELRMMFSCCSPDVSEDAQVALVLSLLCGFSAHEVAEAFLVSLAAMEKRLARAKKVLSG